MSTILCCTYYVCTAEKVTMFCDALQCLPMFEPRSESHIDQVHIHTHTCSCEHTHAHANTHMLMRTHTSTRTHAHANTLMRNTPPRRDMHTHASHAHRNISYQPTRVWFALMSGTPLPFVIWERRAVVGPLQTFRSPLVQALCRPAP